MQGSSTERSARAAARYPVRGDAEDRFLVGWILHLVHALLVPVLPFVFVLGHLAGVTRTAALGVEPPGFRDVGALAGDTVRAVAVTAAYAVPTASALYGAAVLLPSGSPPPALVAALGVALLGVLLPMLYAYPASLAHAAVTRSLRAGFDSGRVGGTLRDADYFTRWAAAASAFVVGVACARFLGEYLVGYLFAFYFEVLAAACIGWGVRGHVEP